MKSLLNFRTQVNPKKPNRFNTFNNNNQNFQQNPVMIQHSNFNNLNNLNMNTMNNQMSNFGNNMNNINQMNIFNNMNNNSNNMSFMNNNMNQMSNMSIINNNMNQMSNMNNINQMNNMNNNMNNLNNININMNNNMNNNSMIKLPNSQINQFNSFQNNNQGNQINNKLQCNLCSKRVTKPKMCRYCSQLSCTQCLNSWLNFHDYCQNCKAKVTNNDFINQSFEDNMSISGNNSKYNLGKAEMIQNKYGSMVIPKNMNIGNVNNNNLYNISNNNEQNMNQGSCPMHNNRLEYYCFQCDHSYCSNCLIFFGQDVAKHKNHFILKLSKMNDAGIKQVLNEYKKLSDTKSKMDDIIGICNYKLKENYIKQNEFESQLSIIKDSYMKKLDDSLRDLDGVLNDLKTRKEKIDNSIGSIPNGFNNIINSNDHVQGGLISQELKRLNNFDPRLENNIKQLAKNQPKLFVKNYQSDIIEISIPLNGAYNEGIEIFNQNLNFVEDNNSKLIIKYLQNKVCISFIIDINLPINSQEFPKFYCYMTIMNQKYGLEFDNLLSQNFPQDFIRPNIGNRNFQQINNNEFDFGQFISMAEEDKKIKMKIFVMKVYYKC